MIQVSSQKSVVAASRSARSKLFARSVLSVAVGLMVGTTALAQKSEGTIFGTAKAGTSVTITSMDNGSVRKVQVDASGNFVLPLLSPGSYQLESGGVKKTVSVAMGSGTQVNLNAQDALESVSVVAKRTAPAIDVSSQESNTVFTAEQIQQLPVSRAVNAVAQLAPGVVKAGTGYGDMPSFGGASVAENGYYINGFDVTNIRNFLSYADLPFDSISQQQIKTGGFGVEYGRSMGGVVSLSTKRGTNEWHGGLAAYYVPETTETSPNVMNKEPLQAGTYWMFNTPQRSRSLVTNFYLGGPLIADKLFVFGLLESPNRRSDIFGQSTSYRATQTDPSGMLKLDFLPLEGHKLEYTYINNKKKTNYDDYTNASAYSVTHDGASNASVTTEGGMVNILKYTGYITDDLSISALAGNVEYQNPSTTGYRVSAKTCPRVRDVNGTNLGCWVPPGYGVGYARAADAPAFDMDNRDAYRIDVDYNIGAHRLKAGLDNQTFTSTQGGGAYYSGGMYYRYQALGSGVTSLNGVTLPASTPYALEYIYNTTGGSFKVINTAKYIEDSWNVTPKLMLYGGLRWESFNNKNGAGESFVKADDLLAPRGGFSFDVNGDSSLKVFGNLGRYYIPVASNTNVRMTQAELYQVRYLTYTGRDARTAAPLNQVQVGPTVNLGADGSLPNPASVADQNLKPMSQDELIIGFQQAISKGWTAGVKYTKRLVNDGMDDYCDHIQMAAYIKANVDSAYSDNLPQCVLINPGRPITIAVDLKDDGKLSNVTIPAASTGLVPYTREYNALEFSLAKEFDGKWGGSASYTYSKSFGTAEGYVNSTIQQTDAGVSQDFDFGKLADGSNGPLPNQHTHAFKIFGTISLTDNFRLGANFSAISGRPISRIGFVPSDSGGVSQGYSTASSYYYLDSTGKTVLGQRGDQGETDWVRQLDLQLAYTDKVGKSNYTLQLDIFNVLNSQAVTDVNQVNDYSRATTTVGQVGQLSQNYGLPLAFQAPRAVRISARYEF